MYQKGVSEGTSVSIRTPGCPPRAPKLKFGAPDPRKFPNENPACRKNENEPAHTACEVRFRNPCPDGTTWSRIYQVNYARNAYLAINVPVLTCQMEASRSHDVGNATVFGGRGAGQIPVHMRAQRLGVRPADLIRMSPPPARAQQVYHPLLRRVRPKNILRNIGGETCPDAFAFPTRFHNSPFLFLFAEAHRRTRKVCHTFFESQQL